MLILCLLPVGLIPAGAGQTLQASPLGNAQRAHPRGCGADSPGCLVGPFVLGSSPRVRGRHQNVSHRGLVGGLIPAGAGQTRPPTPAALRSTAHPRGCGADLLDLGLDLRDWGSSPRVRGRQPRHGARAVTPGLIPAGAGQTVMLLVVRRRCRAHPRGCGADAPAAFSFAPLSGSSPRVRGRHSRVGQGTP